jgi:Fe-S-cluster-containing hydrogenase component 2
VECRGAKPLCQGFGGVPQLLKSPKIGGYRGLKEKPMPEKVAAVDYTKCCPEKCDSGVCVAARECEHGSLKQEMPYETPVINPSKWCHGCAKCVKACPLKAIRML